MSSVEVVEQRIASHEAECSKHKTWISGELKEIRAELGGKITYQHFYSIIGILVTILIGLSGYMAAIINDTRDKATLTQIDVSIIKGKLDPYEIKYEK